MTQGDKMKDFKKFVKSQQQKENNDAKKQQNTDDMPKLSDFKEEDVNLVKDLTEKYSGNKDKLVNDIVSLAKKNKKEGKLNNDQLDEFEKKLKPMLNSKQKKMLDDIMNIIKKV